MMGTGANAQVLRMVMPTPSIPMPPMIIAFIATRNICKPKKEQQFTTSQLPKILFLKVILKDCPSLILGCFSKPSFSG